MWARLRALVGRLIGLGVSAEDDEQARLRTTTTTLIALVLVVLAPTWIVTYRFERREAVEVKGKGLMTTYVVLGPLVPDAAESEALAQA